MTARKLTPKLNPWNFSDEPLPSVRPEFERIRPAQAFAVDAFEEEMPPPFDRSRVMFIIAASLSGWGIVIGLGWFVVALVS